MAIPRPPRGLRWIFSQTSSYDIAIALFASVAGLSAAWTSWSQNRPLPASLALAGTLGVLIFSVIKQAVSLAAARKRQSTHELEGCLHTLHEVLAPGTCKVRLAIHVPVNGDLEQVTEYVGDPPKTGQVGRRFPANAGIIGKALRENRVFIARRVNDEYEAYVRELITAWSYTDQQARLLNPGAMAWMAAPIYDRQGRSDAILYLDANQRDFFTPERQELVLAAIRGIAVFVGKRYTESRTS
ncbi:MAG TPA: GAF domain-containing protein [Vicinamibacterales bacterium]|nr:GAF domain-containing protein [Vicinamibacterales bacterium]